MQITIVGNDFVNLCDVPRRNHNKIFFILRNGMYKCEPQEFTRRRVTKYGEYAGTDECIIFKEGSLTPYHHKDKTVSYLPDDLMAEIDSEKITYKNKGFGKFFGSLDSQKLWPIVVLGISAIVVIGAFIGGM